MAPARKYAELTEKEKVFRRRTIENIKQAQKEEVEILRNATEGPLRRKKWEEEWAHEMDMWPANKEGEKERSSFFYICNKKFLKGDDWDFWGIVRILNVQQSNITSIFLEFGPFRLWLVDKMTSLTCMSIHFSLDAKFSRGDSFHFGRRID